LKILDLTTLNGGNILISLLWIYFYSICLLVTWDRLKNEKKGSGKP
jgi:hypothetical protein